MDRFRNAVSYSEFGVKNGNFLVFRPFEMNCWVPTTRNSHGHRQKIVGEALGDAAKYFDLGVDGAHPLVLLLEYVRAHVNCVELKNGL